MDRAARLGLRRSRRCARFPRRPRHLEGVRDARLRALRFPLRCRRWWRNRPLPCRAAARSSQSGGARRTRRLRRRRWLLLSRSWAAQGSAARGARQLSARSGGDQALPWPGRQSFRRGPRTADASPLRARSRQARQSRAQQLLGAGISQLALATQVLEHGTDLGFAEAERAQRAERLGLGFERSGLYGLAVDAT